MNAVAAVAIIIAVFFIAGLMVGFLIVMALPALVGRRHRDRAAARRGDGRRASSERRGARRAGDGYGPGRPGWPAARPWPGTGPSSGDPDGEDGPGGADGADGPDGPDGAGGADGAGGPPDIPRWRNTR
ncbi:MAG: hypothetical protein JWM19_5019 [Actinomycetia bacterium]|nr:hypothetical protein [Actinomycetes bacterium]